MEKFNRTYGHTVELELVSFSPRWDYDKKCWVGLNNKNEWKEEKQKFPEWKFRKADNTYFKKKDLERELLKVSLNHCAFCDVLLEPGAYDINIEHYYPKDINNGYPELAYSWENLFPCCAKCTNVKDNKDPKDALRPDLPDYEFLDYFEVDAYTGKICVSSIIFDNEIKRKAKAVIELYDLNRGALVERRYEYLLDFETNKPKNKKMIPFRFLLRETNEEDILAKYLQL